MREGTFLTISLFTVITVVTLIASPLFGHTTSQEWLEKAHLLLPLRTELGLWQAHLAAAPRVHLRPSRVPRPVTSHTVPTKQPSVSVVLPRSWPVLPPARSPVVLLALHNQDAHQGQQERLGELQVSGGTLLGTTDYVNNGDLWEINLANCYVVFLLF